MRTQSEVSRRYAMVIAFVIALGPAWAGAQIVRGNVTDRASGLPIGGAVLTLQRAPAGSQQSAEEVASVLSDDHGAYALRAVTPGRYLVSAKRIGVRRFVSEPFELGVGETRRVDIVLETAVRTLSQVVVSTDAPCTTRREQAQRVASLWEEARTALTATRISRRDRLFQARVARYRRELDPRSLRIGKETREEQAGYFDRPFRSVSADSLSRFGYWRSMPDRSTLYFAPDADVLLSYEFLRDHCFGVARPTGDRPGLVGLSFEPVRGRTTPDIRGTIWLDEASSELRFVEFGFTELEEAANATHIGGELHFARLPSGAWIVTRWFIRMPRYTLRERSMSSLRSLTVAQLAEEGGDVVAEGVLSSARIATLTGDVLDSTGGPLPDATVRLEGTRFQTRSDARGQFRLDSIPVGTFRLVVDHPMYMGFGMPLAVRDTLTLAAGGVRRVSFRAPTTQSVIARLCQGKLPDDKRATLRVTLLDSVSAIPLAKLPARLSWKEFGGGPGSIQIRAQEQDGQSDASGSITFCDVPADLPLQLTMPSSREPTRVVTVFRLIPRELVARTVRIMSR